ncbi:MULTISPECIES: ATP-dependent zinc protease family protein [Halorhodospira]|uniref:ATP-dependent zinc protease family protein n=1 Tax=Halorhodospira TaxID=85108 RepID=UPI00191323FC|nr:MULTISPECIES: RimK/LysX family protein [Halorhodospira]MBK5944582.1 hypothetical protein [Halorhodospira halophila]MCG5540582.1 RimK/LysX family protein [Halorhodospira sp. M39old]MCG5546219.1 RimK/LysX family protein [Halorhodospira sp. M38]
MALINLPRAALLAVGGALLLAGCTAPDHLLIEKAETERFEQRFDSVDERLEALAEAQERSRELAREAQLARIAGAMEAQTANRWLVPLRPVDPGDPECSDEPACPDDQLRPGQELSADGMLVFGEIEELQLDPPGLLFDARIDTGASTSSVDAREIEEFERDGEPWVRFQMLNPDGDGRIAIERPKARSATIVQASGRESRPVVELHVTIGRFSETAEFTLTDRSHLTYPVLIGRDVLRDVAVVDVGLKRATEPVTPDDEDLDAIDADDHVEEIVEEDDEDPGEDGDDDDKDDQDNDTDGDEQEADDDDGDE